MGQGIGAVIPTVFRAKKDREVFTKGYILTKEAEQERYYEIDPQFLLCNFKEFYQSFEALSKPDETPWIHKHWEELDEIARHNNLEEFVKFLKEKSQGWFPNYIDTYRMISTLDMDVYQGILFYDGTYKAFLEDYTILTHMEKMLTKCIDNPLADAVKYCMYG